MPLVWAWIALAAIVTWAFSDEGKKHVKNDGHVGGGTGGRGGRKPSVGHRKNDGSGKRVKRKASRKKGNTNELAPKRENDGGDVRSGAGDDLSGKPDGPAPENPGVNPDQHKEGESK